jgi:PAS domain S-box-containing protein
MHVYDLQIAARLSGSRHLPDSFTHTQRLTMPRIIHSPDTYFSQDADEQNLSRAQIHEALLKTGALQSAILNSANFSIIATDAKGIIQLFNAGAERMLGYTAAALVNRITPADIADQQQIIARSKALSSKFDTQITSGFEALVFNAMRGNEDIYELNYIRKDGSRFPALVSVSALRDEYDAISGYLFHGTDNTARKQAEAELALLYEEQHDRNAGLKNAMLAAENAKLAKAEFLLSMGNELYIPLKAILELAHLLESDSPSSTPARFSNISQIIRAGEQQQILINDILSLAKAESARLVLAPEAVSVYELMQECQAMLEARAQQRDIRLILPKNEIRYFVYADRSRIKQVLLSLISNAIQHNREHGTVTLEYSEITPGRIRVNISDSGVGMHPKQIAQVFHAFNRVRNKFGNETKSGLVVAKRLVELMGGTLGVNSTLGDGSVFWFEFDSITDPRQYAETGAATLAQPRMLRDAGPHTLLYVEDNPASMQLVEQVIARQPDIRLLTAENGNSGIEIARVSKPDVILMDINLPDMSGFKALAVLRADPSTAHIPVIAISSNTLSLNINSGLQAGFFRYLTKPIRINELMHELDVALKFAQQNSAKCQ